ncbi:MAG: hypothetical protein QXX68_01555 [Candidatus Pacearchaeota archaeon]
MRPSNHFFLGFIFSLIFYFIFNISLLEFTALFLSTWFFIDLDIVFLFVLKKKSISPMKFFKWARDRRDFVLSLNKEQRKKYIYPFRLFHSVEVLILIFLFSFFNKIFLYVLIGFIFHLILDWIDLYNSELNVFHKVSWFYHLKKHKKHKKH